IGLAIGKGKALMRCLSWRMTALRKGVLEERRLLIRSVKSHKALLSPKVTKALAEKIHFYSSGAEVGKEIKKWVQYQCLRAEEIDSIISEITERANCQAMWMRPEQSKTLFGKMKQ
ncbi:MAG: hypothetical protein VZR24_20475, partial [Butyrivibrio hungatei]|nr:hypothetical protein [Butyrivibrio hungatei]